MGFFDKLFNGKTSEKESSGSNPAQSAQNAASAAVPQEPQDMELRFGNPNVPYDTEVCGTSVTLGLRYRGIAKVSAADAVKVKNCGGLAALQDKLKEEIIAVGDKAWMQCSAAKIPFARLQTQLPIVANNHFPSSDPSGHLRYHPLNNSNQTGLRLDNLKNRPQHKRLSRMDRKKECCSVRTSRAFLQTSPHAQLKCIRQLPLQRSTKRPLPVRFYVYPLI